MYNITNRTAKNILYTTLKNRHFDLRTGRNVRTTRRNCLS